MATIHLLHRDHPLRTTLTRDDLISRIQSCKKVGETFLPVTITHSFYIGYGKEMPRTSHETYYIAIDHIQYITP